MNCCPQLLFLLVVIALGLVQAAEEAIKEHLRGAFQKDKVQLEKKQRIDNPDYTNPFVFPSNETDAASNRIIGGRDAAIGRYPYYSRLDFNGNFRCGGTLVTPDMVLSAAHCAVTTLADWTVRVGEYYGNGNSIASAEVRGVVGQYIHPLYDTIFSGFDYDVMLLKLDRPVVGVQTVNLNFNTIVPIPGSRVTAVGLGQQFIGFPDVLQEVTLLAFGFLICANFFGWVPSQINPVSMICASFLGRATCSGDSGGPLLVKGLNASADTQVGITSFGGLSCVNPVTPPVFTRVSGVQVFIRTTICDNSDEPDPFNC